MIIVSIAVCVFLMVSCNTGSAITQSQIRNLPNVRGSDVKDYSAGNRVRRMSIVRRFKAKSIMVGLKAAQTLLHGASGTNSPKIFVKRGDYLKALNDFDSVEPRGVRTVDVTNRHSAGIWKIGKVGDRRIMLSKAGTNGYPVIKLSPYKDAYKTEGKEFVMTFIYKPY